MTKENNNFNQSLKRIFKKSFENKIFLTKDKIFLIRYLKKRLKKKDLRKKFLDTIKYQNSKSSF